MTYNSAYYPTNSCQCPIQPVPTPLRNAFGGITSNDAAILTLSNGQDIINLATPLPSQNLNLSPGAIKTVVSGIYKVFYELPLLMSYYLAPDEDTLQENAVVEPDPIRQRIAAAGSSGIDISGLLDLLARVRAGVVCNGAILQNTATGLYTSSCCSGENNITLASSSIIELSADSTLNLAMWSKNNCDYCYGNTIIVLPGAKLILEQLG